MKLKVLPLENFEHRYTISNKGKVYDLQTKKFLRPTFAGFHFFKKHSLPLSGAFRCGHCHSIRIKAKCENVKPENLN